jgi:hypothetical protein
MDKNIQKRLLEVQGWARENLKRNDNPPWAFYQYMKLIETTEAILNSIASAVTTMPKPEGLQQSVEHLGNGLRLVVNNGDQENSQHHSNTIDVALPM